MPGQLEERFSPLNLIKSFFGLRDVDVQEMQARAADQAGAGDLLTALLQSRDVMSGKLEERFNPLNLIKSFFGLRDVDSLQEMQARNAARDEAGDLLTALLQSRDVMSGQLEERRFNPLNLIKSLLGLRDVDVQEMQARAAAQAGAGDLLTALLQSRDVTPGQLVALASLASRSVNGLD